LYDRLRKRGHLVHAFGAGAIGRTMSYNYQNSSDINQYIEMVNAGVKPMETMFRTPGNSTLINTVISQLDSGYLRFDQVNRLAETDVKSVLEPLVESWANRGMATIDSNVLRLTPVGQFWYVNMTQAIIKVLHISQNSHYFPEILKETI
jgi:oxygen-independent coproporphyrinogen-3 oxidase